MDLGHAGHPEREHTGVLQEEVALLGKEEGEAGQVELAVVDLGLREVRVEGEAGGEGRREVVAQVAARVPVPLRARLVVSAPNAGEGVRAHAERAGAGDSPEDVVG
jgi:hypothetical protein